jgi:uncharacterized membrane protein YoaK (UPF0700 family)
LDISLNTNIKLSYLLAFFMSAIAGFIDTFTFIALDRLFTAHITGNIIIAIAFLLSDVEGVLSKMVAIPVFMILAAMVAFIIETHGINKKTLSFWILIEIVLIIVFFVFGIILLPDIKVTSYTYLFLCMLPVAAMAIHNTVLKTYMCKIPPCTVMTGNLTKLVIDTVVYVMNFSDNKHDNQKTAFVNIKRFFNVLLGFSLGAGVCALGYYYFGFYALIFEIILFFTLMLIILKSDHQS